VLPSLHEAQASDARQFRFARIRSPSSSQTRMVNKYGGMNSTASRRLASGTSTTVIEFDNALAIATRWGISGKIPDHLWLR
jgi:hypothetical protein